MVAREGLSRLCKVYCLQMSTDILVLNNQMVQEVYLDTLGYGRKKAEHPLPFMSKNDRSRTSTYFQIQPKVPH